MSHSGPAYGEIMGAEARRVAQEPTVEQVVEAVLRAVKGAPQEDYKYHQAGAFVTVSPHSHAELLRKTIEDDVKAAAWKLNAYTYPERTK